MSEIITWEKINDSKKYDYFALGLQPCFKETHKPIPCPEYCHELHILLNTPRYTHINTTREKLKEWENETKKNKTISICLTNCSNLLLYLIRSCGNTLSKFNIMNNISVEDKKNLEAIMVQGVDRNNEQKLKAALIQKFGEKDDRLEEFQKILYNDPDNINLTLEDVRKLEVVFDQESVKDNERSEKLDEIIKNDPDRNSWIFFQMPNSGEKGKELYDLLSEAVFDKEQVDKIREKSSGKNQLSKLSDLEDKLNEELKKICPELEKFYAALVDEIDLGDYGVEDSINKIGAPELH
ncbi:hypothetical protein, partial [Desulfobacula sp.]|uniref:hypothetical protein n=1 Tax=Desulfobacula sp. TaxID=2593537 RepID=UPI0025BB4747